MILFLLSLALNADATFFNSSSSRVNLTFEKENQKCLRAHNQPKEIYSREFEPYSLEAKFCERMYATSVKQAFQEGFDIPATQLNITQEQITDGFSKKFSEHEDSKVIFTPEYRNNTSMNNYIRQSVMELGYYNAVRTEIRILDDHKSHISHGTIKSSAPWDFIIDLNLQAAQLWQEMLACSSNDAEKARRNYYLAQWECDEDIQQKMKQFYDSVFIMLITANIKNTKSSTLMPKVHPLYSQVLLEHYATMTRNIEVDKGSPLPYQVTIEIEAVQNHYQDFNLHPLANVHKKVYNVDIHSASSVQRGKALVNLFNLLDLLPVECEAFGLWPGAARPLLTSYDSIYTDSDLEIRHIKNKLFLACGTAHPSLYSDYLNIYENHDEIKNFYKTYREIYRRNNKGI